MTKPWEFEDPLCAEVGVEIFFAQDHDAGPPGRRAENYTEAKKICDMCSHKIECAEWGIKHEIHGLWGGLTPQERKSIRKRQRLLSIEIIK